MAQDPDQPAQQLSDERLLSLYRDGRNEAFDLLMKRYELELFHFLIRFCGDRATAEDLFQETFLQVHQSAGTFDVERRFKPWLFTIAANKARDQLRRNSRRVTSALSAPVGDGGDGETTFIDLMQADLPLPQDEARQHETQELVRQVVAAMPEHLREVLLLAYFQQLPYRDIAEMLGIPLGTVKSRLHAAVGTFAQSWKDRFGDAEPPV